MSKKMSWLEQLTNSHHIGILVVDKNHKNLFVNARLSKIFGYSKKKLLNATVEIFHINHAMFLKFSQLTLNSVIHDTPLEIDYQFKHKNGTLFWAHISGDPTKNDKEVLWAIVDLTQKTKSQKKIKKISERAELALLGNNDGIWDWNLLTNKVYYSHRWKEMLGYNDDELSNEFSTWRDLAHKDDIASAIGDVEDHIKGKINYVDNVHRLKHKDGHWIWVHNRAKAIFNEDGDAIRMIGTHTDITQAKSLQLKYTQQAQIIQQIHDSVISFNLNGIITSFNHGSEILFGYVSNQAVGKHISMLYKKENVAELQQSLAIVTEIGEYNTDTYLLKKSKKLIAVSLSLSLLHNEIGDSIGMVFYAQDITIRKKAEEALKEQKDILAYRAYHDSLTNLPNRLLFNDRLTQTIKKAKRNNLKVALLFIDLDHFKEINDSLGHDIGDEVLKIITSRLKDTLRDKDTLARLGGDEFTVILGDLEEVQNVSSISSKILIALSKPIIIQENTLYVSSSIGISIYPDDGNNTQDLLKFADSAMYKAKNEGRNNYQFYDSIMTEKAFERVFMETNLREALKKGELVVYYQPQVDGNTNKLIGIEALVRWRHPTMGLVPPAKFIPLAESTGLIIEIDEFVMRTAMKQLSTWYKKGLNPGILAMNLSMRQLQQQKFTKAFANLIKETNCEAKWLELEVTEGQIMAHPEKAVKILKDINNLGVDLAIDDFGTGYSSLAYLKKLPLNKLKIDQTFIKDLPGNDEDASITKAVIALGQSLKLNIIAEGVETKEQKDFIIESGCDNIQGYFYSKPVPAKDLENILKKGIQKN